MPGGGAAHPGGGGGANDDISTKVSEESKVVTIVDEWLPYRLGSSRSNRPRQAIHGDVSQPKSRSRPWPKKDQSLSALTVL